jgi:hypothetical protein
MLTVSIIELFQNIVNMAIGSTRATRRGLGGSIPMQTAELCGNTQSKATSKLP